MKRIIFYTIALFLVFAYTACEENGLKTYEGGAMVYFDKNMNSKEDSTSTSFAFGSASVTDTVMSVLIRTTGAPVDMDRTFRMEPGANTTAEEGRHYLPFGQDLVIPAGKVSAIVKIRVNRTEDMQTESKELELELHANENFTTEMDSVVVNQSSGLIISALKHRLIISDVLTKPENWMDEYLGTFSRKKCLMFCELSGFTPKDLTLTYSLEKMIYWASKMKSILAEADSKGETIYEEDGVTKMTMGPAV